MGNTCTPANSTTQLLVLSPLITPCHGSSSTIWILRVPESGVRVVPDQIAVARILRVLVLLLLAMVLWLIDIILNVSCRRVLLLLLLMVLYLELGSIIICSVIQFLYIIYVIDLGLVELVVGLCVLEPLAHLVGCTPFCSHGLSGSRLYLTRTTLIRFWILNLLLLRLLLTLWIHTLITTNHICWVRLLMLLLLSIIQLEQLWAQLLDGIFIGCEMLLVQAIVLPKPQRFTSTKLVQELGCRVRAHLRSLIESTRLICLEILTLQIQWFRHVSDAAVHTPETKPRHVFVRSHHRRGLK